MPALLRKEVITMDEARIKALEFQVQKLDRLVYRLFRDMKQLIAADTVTKSTADEQAKSA